ncbi:hypothetical protein SAMN03003324_02909 [Pedobacter antarcticus]|nr:hypothetical protein [Pedobacter antarcticus]SFF21824.1 hypothetical protein SAMN03003324_02909 [Pedobacter antarcticus]
MNLKTIALFIVMTALWSCKKDNEKEQALNQSDIHLSMEIAKDLLSNFESREKSNLRESIPRNLISSKNRIDWQKAKEYMLNGYKIIEVPYKRDTLTFRNYSYEPYSKNTGYSEIKNIQTKLLISEKNLGSTISIDIINYIPKKNTSLNTNI